MLQTLSGRCHIPDSLNTHHHQQHLTAPERIGAGDPIAGNAYNFSCDSNATVLDVVTRVLALAGSTLEPDVRHTSKNEIRDQRVDSRKAREELGWLPQHTMEQGLARTIEWYRQHLAAENSRVSEG